MSWNEQITVSRINNLKKKNAKSVINRPTHLLKIQLRKSDKITTFAPPTITPPPIDAATVPSSPRPERWDLDLNLHHLKAAAKTLNEPWIFSSMQWTPFPLTFPPQSHLSPIHQTMNLLINESRDLPFLLVSPSSITQSISTTDMLQNPHLNLSPLAFSKPSVGNVCKLNCFGFVQQWGLLRTFSRWLGTSTRTLSSKEKHTRA